MAVSVLSILSCSGIEEGSVATGDDEEASRIARVRQSEAVRVEEMNGALALARFREVLKALPDPRRRQGLRYPLESVVVIALMAMVCGAEDAEAMDAWGEANAEWLGEFLLLPHGAPSQDVFLAMFAALDPVAFGAVFREWVAVLVEQVDDVRRHIAVDGKTSRRSHDRQRGKPPIHTLSALAVESGLVIGQLGTDEKSNEIEGLQRLLSLLDLRGATVSVDAMGCQTAVAALVREREGDYLLAVRGNQPTLLRDIEASFEDADDSRRRRPVDQPKALPSERHRTVEKDHGRVETRNVTVIRDLRYLETADRWVDASYIVRVCARRLDQTTGKETLGTRYFIGSGRGASVKDIGDMVRNHWNIENGLLWVLDMGFDEDQARHRSRNCARNLAILRHFALDLLKSETTCKLGVKNKRKKAGWSGDYLLAVLTGVRG